MHAVSPKTSPRFSGVIPPLVTPRTAAGELDLVGLASVVEHQIAGGVDGLFVLGSSGETPYLTTDERRAIVRATREAAAGRVPVFAGANEMTTARTIEEAAWLAQEGVDALVVTTPYYAISNQDEVLRHFRAVRAAVDLPLFAYDVPVRTHLKMSVETLVTLAEEGVIDGVKDSSGDDVAFRRLLLATAHLPEFSAFTGHEVVVDGALLAGGHGVVPGLGNVDPAGYVRLYRAAQAGDWAAAKAEQDRLARLFEIVFVPGTARVSGGAAGLGAFKTALVLMGVIDSNVMAAPMDNLDAEATEEIRAIVAESGLEIAQALNA